MSGTGERTKTFYGRDNVWGRRTKLSKPMAHVWGMEESKSITTIYMCGWKGRSKDTLELPMCGGGEVEKEIQTTMYVCGERGGA